jgi:hypothetical protein
MPAQDAPAKGVLFAHGDCPYTRRFRGQINAADVQMPENNDKAVIVSGILRHLTIGFVFGLACELFVEFVNGVSDRSRAIARVFRPPLTPSCVSIGAAFPQERL